MVDEDRKQHIRAIAIASLTFAVMTAVMLVMWFRFVRVRDDADHRAAYDAASRFLSSVNHTLEHNLVYARILAQHWETVPSRLRAERAASLSVIIASTGHSRRTISFLDTMGVCRMAHPSTGSPWLVGGPAPRTPADGRARLVCDRGGRPAFVDIRLPAGGDGSVSVTHDIDSLLAQSLDDTDLAGMAVGLTVGTVVVRQAPRPENGAVAAAPPVSREILGERWTVTGVVLPEAARQIVMFAPWFIPSMEVTVCLLIALFLYLALKRHGVMRRSNRELRTAMENYHAIFDAVDDAMIITDAAAGSIVEINAKAAEMLPKQHGGAFDGLFEEADRAAAAGHFRQAAEGVPQLFERRVRAAGGGTFWGSVGLRRAVIAGNRRVIAVIRDVSERRRTDDELRKNAEFITAVLEQMPVGVVVSDLADQRALFVNRRFLDIHGCDRDLLADLVRFNERVYPDPGYRTAVRRRLLDGLQSGNAAAMSWDDVRIMRGDGQERVVWFTAIPVQAQNLLIMTARDVTERRRLETERRQIEDQLRQAQKMEAVGQLAGGIAHDFNNILAGIIGFSEMILRQLPERGPLRDDVQQILDAASRAAELTRQLLAFSRKQTLDMRVLDLNGHVRSIEKLLRRVIGEDVDLRLFLSPSLKNVRADPGQVDQVIMNLAVNARDAMPDGGMLSVETANVHLDEEYAGSHQPLIPGPYVVISVSDTGAGMEPGVLKQVFEPFFTTKEKGKGTGLGLSTVYGIVRQHDGHVTVYSEPGKGSTFKIYLPACREDGAKPAVAPSASGTTGTEPVLVVEDEEIIRRMTRRILAGAGYRVTVAATPADAIALFDAMDPAAVLLLTDVVLPGMSGKQLYERLSQKRPGLKVLYVSGYTDNVIAHHGILEPGTHFLQKPYMVEDLLRKIRGVIDG